MSTSSTPLSPPNDMSNLVINQSHDLIEKSEDELHFLIAECKVILDELKLKVSTEYEFILPSLQKIKKWKSQVLAIQKKLNTYEDFLIIEESNVAMGDEDELVITPRFSTRLARPTIPSRPTLPCNEHKTDTQRTDKLRTSGHEKTSESSKIGDLKPTQSTHPAVLLRYPPHEVRSIQSMPVAPLSKSTNTTTTTTNTTTTGPTTTGPTTTGPTTTGPTTNIPSFSIDKLLTDDASTKKSAVEGVNIALDSSTIASTKPSRLKPLNPGLTVQTSVSDPTTPTFFGSKPSQPLKSILKRNSK